MLFSCYKINYMLNTPVQHCSVRISTPSFLLPFCSHDMESEAEYQVLKHLSTLKQRKWGILTKLNNMSNTQTQEGSDNGGGGWARMSTFGSLVSEGGVADLWVGRLLVRLPLGFLWVAGATLGFAERTDGGITVDLLVTGQTGLCVEQENMH